MTLYTSAVYNNNIAMAIINGGSSNQCQFNSETNFNINQFLNYDLYGQQQTQQNQSDNILDLLNLDDYMSYIMQPLFPINSAPVAANETGKITGDPHFTGGDGGRYDVQGEAGKVYNLLDDSHLNFNGRFDAWGSGGATVVGETAINVSDFMEYNFSSITFNKDGVAKVNGEELQDGETVNLADGGTATKEGNKLTVTTAEGYQIIQTCHPSCNGNYINTTVNTGDAGVASDNVLPGGLLGQTFDADDVARDGKKGRLAQGEGAIDGVVTDYETSLNQMGDVKLDENGNIIQEVDPFAQMVQELAGLLQPPPYVDFLQVLDFVMDTFFTMLFGQNQDQTV